MSNGDRYIFLRYKLGCSRKCCLNKTIDALDVRQVESSSTANMTQSLYFTDRNGEQNVRSTK